MSATGNRPITSIRQIFARRELRAFVILPVIRLNKLIQDNNTSQLSGRASVQRTLADIKKNVSITTWSSQTLVESA